MPKAARRPRLGAHDHSVRAPDVPSKRQFASAEQGVERVEVGSMAGVPASTILSQLSAEPSAAQPQPQKKKDRLRDRHDSFIQRLDASTSHAPYAASKSHLRRLRKKLKDGIPMADVREALEEVEEPMAEEQEEKREKEEKKGMIGEGKGSTLSAKQRKKALQAEQARHSAILSDPAFRANPFAAIRLHAANSLIPAEDSRPGEEPKG